MQALKTAAGLAAIALATGCARQAHMPALQQGAPRNASSASSASSASTARAAAPPAARERLSDANIGALLVALNNTDVSYARLAPTRAQSADVKAFAALMLADHGAVTELARQLFSRLDVAPEDTPLSLDLRDESATNRDTLRELAGRAFDGAYLANEVRYHKKFLAVIDGLMMEDSQSGELRVFLTKLRPAIVAHLAHAEKLEASLR